MKLIIDIPENLYKATVNGLDANEIWDLRLAVKNGTPLDNLRTELEDYITHSPYIKSFTDCCRLRDDVMRIIDHYRNEVSEF